MPPLRNEGNAARVAVITRTKDRVILLRRAMESVLEQSFQDWVHVIVNDGGDRQMLDYVLEEYRHRYDGRLVVVHHDKPTGMQNASNAGVQAADSEYLVIHDDDDSWSPEFLEKTVGYLNARGPGSSTQGVITRTRLVFEHICADGSVVQSDGGEYFWQSEVSLHRTAAENTFPPIAFLYRRRLHDELGLFNEKFTVMGDWDFNLRVLTRYDIGTIPEPLANYHHRRAKHGGDYGNSVTSGVSEHRAREVVLKNHYLREDIAAGRSGLGYLLETAGEQHENSRILRELADKIQTLRKHQLHVHEELAKTHGKKPTQLPGYSRKVICRPSGVSEQALLGYLDGCTVLSLDVFDTALFRTVRKPTDVFDLLQIEAQRHGWGAGKAIAQARFSAERVARARRMSNHGDDEVTLEEIYECLAGMAGLDGATANQIKECELAIERRVLYANNKILRVARKAKEAGKRVIFVSDMYLPADFVAGILRDQGYEFDELYLSNAERVSKYSGRLFQVVLERLGVDPDDVLHVGDHPVSDDATPTRLGISSVHYAKGSKYTAYADQLGTQSVFETNGVLSSMATGLARKNLLEPQPFKDGQENLAHRIGYEVAGPIYFGFGRWMLDQARADGITKLCFLARDGEFLREAVNRMAARWGIGIETEYIMASRRLFAIPAIKRLDEKTLEMLVKPNPGLKVRDFLLRAGLDPAGMRHELRQSGLHKDLDRVVTTRWHVYSDSRMRGRLKRFFKLAEPALIEVARRERKLLKKYLDEAEISRETTAVADIGWSGTLALAVHKMLGGGSEKSLRAYYFGTWDTAQPAINAGCRIASYFCHLNKPPHRRDLLMLGVELVELLMVSPHATINTIVEKDGIWQPVHGPALFSDQQIKLIQALQAGALKFVDDMLENLTAEPASGGLDAHIELVLRRLLEFPEASEAAMLGDFLHVDGFAGYGIPRPLAQPPVMRTFFGGKKYGSGRILSEAYEASFWKKGFLARYSSKKL